MNKRIMLALVVVGILIGMCFMKLVDSGTTVSESTLISNETVTSTAEATVTPTAEATVTPTAEATVTSTAEATVTPTAEAIVTPTAEATVTPTAEATVTPTAEITVTTFTIPVVEKKNNNGSVTVQDLFGNSSVKTVKDVQKDEEVGNNSTEDYEETLTVQALFGKGKKTEIKVTPVPSPEVIVFTEIEAKTSPMPTLNPLNLGAENQILENGFQLCSFLLNKDGNIIAIENGYELKTRKQTLTSLQTGNSKITKVVRPVENREDDRLNGRFVRSKKPHEVLVKNGQIEEGFSFVPLKLEVVDAQLLEELIGKPAREVTAQDIVASTVVVENHDGKWIAAHKSAPGYRGPLVAKLYLEDGRWLRVEKWNWTLNEGDPKSIGIPSLVFVMCSDRGARTPV